MKLLTMILHPTVFPPGREFKESTIHSCWQLDFSYLICTWYCLFWYLTCFLSESLWDCLFLQAWKTKVPIHNEMSAWHWRRRRLPRRMGLSSQLHHISSSHVKWKHLSNEVSFLYFSKYFSNLNSWSKIQGRFTLHQILFYNA